MTDAAGQDAAAHDAPAHDAAAHDAAIQGAAVASATVDRRLRSWPWRLGHSLWTLWAIFGFGLFTWIGFLYIGGRARNRRWLLMAGLWFVVSLIIAFLAPENSPGQPGPDWYAPLVVAVWLLGAAQSIAALPAWWRWRAQRDGPTWALPGRTPAPAGAGHPAAPTQRASAPEAPPTEAPGTAAAPASTEAPGAAAPPSRPLAVGSVIPGLGVIDALPEDGHGSFGTVYRIRRDFDGKHVAGKVFRAQPGLHGDREADRALRDELEALESLQHPNIVRVMNPVRLGQQGTWMLVSEWVDGTTLESATLGVHRLPDDRVHHVGRQLLDALVYLEAAGVVHRDIKPTNVMIDQSGSVKLIDFNLTRISGRETAVAGTRPYLPPDYLLDGYAVDALVDRFAAGVILFELLTAKHPYLEYEHAAVPVLPTSVPADPRAFRPDLSPAMSHFLSRAVQPVEAKRFPTAIAMREAWEGATGISGQVSPGLSEPRTSTSTPPIRDG